MAETKKQALDPRTQSILDTGKAAGLSGDQLQDYLQYELHKLELDINETYFVHTPTPEATGASTPESRKKRILDNQA